MTYIPKTPLDFTYTKQIRRLKSLKAKGNKAITHHTFKCINTQNTKGLVQLLFSTFRLFFQHIYTTSEEKQRHGVCAFSENDDQSDVAAHRNNDLVRGRRRRRYEARGTTVQY